MTVEKIDLYPEWGFTFSSCVVAGDYVFTSHKAFLNKHSCGDM